VLVPQLVVKLVGCSGLAGRRGCDQCDGEAMKLPSAVHQHV
jgi:hypothetical protein